MKVGGYEIVKDLAKNGLISVYLAHDPAGREVVIKALLPQTAVHEAQKQAFLREISITAALQHRNIVEYIDSGFSSGLLFCVMEYCNGGTLRDVLMKMGRTLTCAEALPMIIQVLAGLDYAHHASVSSPDNTGQTVQGVVHRDIKPENILLHYNEAGQYTAKIADFGLSKAFHLADQYGWTRTGDIGGSLAFLCRQQIINYKYAKPEVDIWGTIAVLYYLLTGFPPRSGKTLSFNTILSMPPKPINEHEKNIPLDLATLIDTALNDTETLYFKNAADLRNELKKFV